MGEIADMMLDGTMCAGCGEFLHDGEDGNGFPEWCSGCGGGEQQATPKKLSNSKRKRRQRKRRNYQRNRDERLQNAIAIGLTKEWEQKSPYHYQRRIDGVLCDWWPSSRKFMVMGMVNVADNPSEIYDIIESMKKAEA